MGLAMATNLQKHMASTKQPALLYTNRTMSRGAPLSELGSQACSSVSELVQKSDIIFISVCSSWRQGLGFNTDIHS